LYLWELRSRGMRAELGLGMLNPAVDIGSRIMRSIKAVRPVWRG